ncbi:MAG: glycosyltransferase [Ignavibacteriaceae bacterium]|nr:glycosyltransferase [Ignavibacteriaceae bacterium]
MDLSIIIVNYNVKEFLQNLLHSISKSSKQIKREIIIVDNASNDGSIEFITNNFPEVNLIANNDNLGFSKANNIGLKKATGKYILLINPDTLVSEDTFEKMIGFFEENPEVGLAGCKILNPDGTLQLACRRSFPGPWTSFCKVTGLSNLFPESKLFARYNLTYLDPDRTYEVDAVSGSFMMFRRDVYERIGGLDEKFFMYGEDLDFCYRSQKSGFKVFYVHSTQIIHYKGESTKKSGLDETKIFYNAMNLFVKKHLSGSFLLGLILQSAIIFRKLFAFLGKRRLASIALVLDFIFYDLSILCSEKIYIHFKNSWAGFPPFSLIIVYTVPAIIHILITGLTGNYKRNEFTILKNFGAIIISFFFVASLSFFFKDFAYSRGVIVLTYLTLFFSLTFWRIFSKLFFTKGLNNNESLQRRTLFVGIDSHTVDIAHKLKQKHTDLHNVIGLISATNKEVGEEISGFKVIGNTENINKVIKDKKINEVIFSSLQLSYNQIMTIVSQSQNYNIDFKLIGNNLDFLIGKTSVSILDDTPLIEINYNISSPIIKLIKRIFDIFLSLSVLFFIYPSIYLTVLISKKQSEFQKFILKIPGVFLGEFSFVGPRENMNLNELYLGKKGLTGLWYVEGSEGKDSEKLNIYYAKNQNIWMDIEILSKALVKMWGTQI